MKLITLFLVVARIILGAFFVIVSVDKLITPHENFLYIVQSYDVFPYYLEELAARLAPWIEFFLGLFLLLGLWLRRTLQGFIILIFSFIILVAQAILRKLPMDDCGCFGELFAAPLQMTLIMDICFLLLAGLMIWQVGKTSHFSLDHYFGKSDRK